MTTDTMLATLGLRSAVPIGLGNINGTVHGTLGWRHASGDTKALAAMGFAGSDAFTITGLPIADNNAIIGAGLDFHLTSTATHGVSYQGHFSNGTNRNSFNARFRVSF